jgi:hypothetical protein
VILVAYDLTLKRPACMTLQAVMGGTRGIASRFHSQTWLLTKTKDMQLYPLDDYGQLAKLVQITEKHPSNAKAIADWQAILKYTSQKQRKEK